MTGDDFSDEKNPLNRALAVLGVPEDRNIRKQIIDDIEAVARRYKEGDPAIRPKAVIEKLEQIRKLSGQLADELADVDDYSQFLLLGFLGDGIQYAADQLIAEAGISKPTDMAKQMKARAELALLGRRAFCEFEGLDEKTPVKGGEKVHPKFKGSPKRLLVRSCFTIFDRCIPNVASGYADGQFCKFTAAIYELATGQQATDKGANIEKIVEEEVPRVRKEKANLKAFVEAARAGEAFNFEKRELKEEDERLPLIIHLDNLESE